jgi:hypothetical protein
MLSAAATGRQDGIFQASTVKPKHVKSQNCPPTLCGHRQITRLPPQPSTKADKHAGKDMASTLFSWQQEIQSSNITLRIREKLWPLYKEWKIAANAKKMIYFAKYFVGK